VVSGPKRQSNVPASERNGQCQAMTRKGEPCRRKALDADGLCLVHNGSQDMRELGRRGGRATPKAMRPDAQRESLREFLRREVDPARVWAAIEAGLESGNDRDRLAASKLLLTELYEPAAERQREEETEAARARERVLVRMEEILRRRVLAGLVERGLIRPGGGRPFAGVVMFSMHELAEWVGNWAPRPVTVRDIACATCGKEGVRLVAEGESVSEGAVHCAPCRPEEETEVSSPGPSAASPDLPPLDEPLRRRS
jgi:hypothetical protein